MKKYNHIGLEEKWLSVWADLKLFLKTADGEVESIKDKLYLLFAFAYPSGSGLHVGHVESKTALDILARYHRMQGKQVFFPVGWDAFGLPAENYAIKTGVHPQKTTTEAIDTFRRQIKRVGISYDWAAELATCHPGYYQWTQWLFLELFKAGLAYQGTGKVNWCPSCQTVLANEQVVDGLCERCDTPVVQKQMKQWFFKITDYQDELIEGLEMVDWPAPTKQQQLNWIGKKQGARVIFNLSGDDLEIPCFTTRVDTIFGVTFVAISPEKFSQLNLIEKVAKTDLEKINSYLEEAAHKTEEERQVGQKEKTGVLTGLEVINPVNQEAVPLLVADYVLGGYGTGAVMGVPAHDERDLEFAQKHDLKVKTVIQAETGEMIDSGKYDGLKLPQAADKLAADFDQVTPETNYKLRDWLISRQRYWGAPIPIVYDPAGNPHPVKPEHLPWKLPTDVDFAPTGESPLRSSVEFKARVEQLYGPGWTPEYDTMDTFVDSSWYFLRYVSARDEDQFASPKQLAKWLPVDFYMIGPEHIVLHLLYARFFTKFLRDQGYLNFDEPFLKMRHQGMILGPDGKKMSKSKGNVINPDEIIAQYGADTLRLYEMFMGPIEADKPWDTSAVNGVYRFLRRLFDLYQNYSSMSNDLEIEVDEALERQWHQTLKKISQDLPVLKFNTAIAALMELVNVWEKTVDPTAISRENMIKLTQVIAPLAPFMAEELYQLVADDAAKSVHLTQWPEWDEALALEEKLTLPVQINGKVRGEIQIEHELADDEAQVLALAKSEPGVASWLEDKVLLKEIYVPGRIINFVIG